MVDTVNREERIDRLLERGLEALHAGDRARAQALLRDVLRREPRNVQAWYAMAWTLPTVRAVRWCLEQVLVIEPGHAEAAAFLEQARKSPERFAARWLEGDLGRLDEALGHVADQVRDAERLADELERHLAALERQAEDGGGGTSAAVAAGEAEVLREEIERAPAEPVDEIRRRTTTRAEQLSAFQRRLMETERRLVGIDWPDDDGEAHLRSLHGELRVLWKDLVRQQRKLRSLERQVEHARDVIAQREIPEPSLGPGTVTIGGRRVSVTAIVLICLGLLLLIAGAVQAYPFIHSRLSSVVTRMAAQASQVATPVTPSATITPLAASAAGSSLVASREGEVSPVSSPTSLPGLVFAPTLCSSSVPSPTSRSLAPTRLVVQKVGINAPVVPVSWQPAEGTGQAEGEWQVPATYAAGWHEGSAGLGVPGNTVLNGHNTTRGEVFRNLYRVGAGDLITVYSNDVSFTYVVSETLILPELGQPRAVREQNASYLLPTEDERLTLVTCHPYGSLRNRLIIIAWPG